VRGETGDAASSPDRSIGSPEYRETLRTPWWWYPVALSVAILLAAEFQVAGYSLTDWIPFLTLVPLSVAVVWWIGRSRLTISRTELTIRDARLPLRSVSGVVALDARTLRRVIGREGNPRAFVAIRPWIGPGIQLQLDDPDDPTPYWVISTRHPDRVMTLLRDAR
jgi:Protein of unknown function (DUF3093)